MRSIKTILEQIQNRDFWKTLNPGLSINEKFNSEPWAIRPIKKQNLESLLLSLKEDGYFQIDSIFPEAEIFRMAIGVEIMYQEDWLPTFAFVYDEFWQIFGQLSSLLSIVLDNHYQQLPAFWAWYINTNNADMGWKPHRDQACNTLQPDGMPKAVTVWIPLTDAIPLNGCMYILPAAFDPDYGRNRRNNQVQNVQDIRALPASAGSILCWNHALLHWGGRSCERSPHPRISLSAEFQRSDAQTFNTPLLDPHTLPNFNQRLALIGKQILQYKHVYVWPEWLLELAIELQNIDGWLVSNPIIEGNIS